MFDMGEMNVEHLIGELLHVSDEDLIKKVAEIASVEQYGRSEQIIEIGQVQTKIQILISGAVRFFYFDEKGKEHTQCFVTEPGYPIMVDAYMGQSLSGCHALTDTRLLTIPMEEGFALIRSYPELTATYVYMLRKSLLFHAELAMILRAGDAHRRYMWFLSAFPGVEEVAKSRHIASFLCITPETLSRIRTKARTEERNYGQMTLNDHRNFDEVRQQIWEDTPLPRKE